MEKSIFKNNQGLIFGLSKKQDGDMKIWPSEANVEARTNRINFFSRIGINIKDVSSALVVHGDKVFVGVERGGQDLGGYDAMITDIPGIVLAITAADCPPIYFFDYRKQVIALAHSGWRGTVMNIVGKTIDKMVFNYNSNPADIQVFIGPRIQTCHFVVGPEVAKEFRGVCVENDNGDLHVNLASAINMQLLAAGLSPRNIAISENCTFCQEEYFSHRRDHFPRVQAGVAYLGMK